MYLFAIIVIALFAIFAIIIGSQNTMSVPIHLLGKTFNSPLFFVMIVTFGAGVVLAFILAIVDEIKLRTRIIKQRREIDNLQKELGTLKTMPSEPEEKEGTV